MSDILREQQSWRTAAARLGIQFEAPFLLVHEGKRYDFLGRLPEFGAPRGMLLMISFDRHKARAALACGFGYSCLELGTLVDTDAVIAVLRDWGWSKASVPQPRWFDAK